MILESINYNPSTSLFEISIDSTVFLLSYEEIEELKLSESMELDNSLIKKVAMLSEYNTAKLSALKYVSRRTISSHKLYTYLRKKEISETSINKIIEEFTKIGLFDDENYIRDYIQTKKDFNRMSRKMIKFKLQQEGFKSGQLEDYLIEYTEDEEFSNAYSLIESKFGRINKDDYTARNKAYQYLYRRGFTNDIINKVIMEAED